MFGNREPKEERQARKDEALLNRYGLTEIDKRDIESVRQIVSDLSGLGLIKTGTLIGGKSEDVAKMGYLSALVEQNWIIIRQLDRLNKTMQAQTKEER